MGNNYGYNYQPTKEFNGETRIPLTVESINIKYDYPDTLNMTLYVGEK